MQVKTSHKRKKPQKRINKQQMQKVSAAILEHLSNEDSLGMSEVMAELSEDEQMFVWGQFDTKQKTAIKALLHSVKEK